MGGVACLEALERLPESQAAASPEVRASRTEATSAGLLEDCFLDWCLQTGTGPASPGRF